MVDNLLGDDFPFAEDILEGVDALVCGASKGIGRSCALMLARSGAKVTVCSRSKDNLEKLIGEMYGRALIPGMEERGMGRIINIISTSVKEPIDGIGLSNTLRGAMASWSKSMSRELPPCITINNILPGWTDTERLNQLAKTKSEKSGISIEEIFRQWEEMTPIKRLIDPMETAAAVLWLCLPSSESIRGVSLAVDGGRMRSI